VLLAFGLRRREIAGLTFDHLQQREEHWAFVDMKVPKQEPDTLFTSTRSIRTQAGCWCTVEQVLLISRDTYSTSSGLPSSRNLSMRSGLRLLVMRPRCRTGAILLGVTDRSSSGVLDRGS
jgi:hypothetical protein